MFKQESTIPTQKSILALPKKVLSATEPTESLVTEKDESAILVFRSIAEIEKHLTSVPLQQVRRLRFCGELVTPELRIMDFLPIAKIIRLYSQVVTHIELAHEQKICIGQPIPTNGIDIFIEAIVAAPKLIYFEINHIDFVSPDACKIAALLSLKPSLQHLTLITFQLGTDAVKIIAETIANGHQLKQLTLIDCDIVRNHAILAKAVAASKHLCNLTLSQPSNNAENCISPLKWFIPIMR